MSVNGRKSLTILLIVLSTLASAGAPPVHGDAVYDFVQNASSATWYSGAGGLPFPGSASDSRGFALNLASAQLEDDVVDDGRYHAAYEAQADGQWSAKVEWGGDSNHEAAAIQELSFTVEAPPMNWLPIALAAAAIAVVAFLVLFLRRNR